ncbi:DNA ligase [Pseudoalteromonas sp. SMS1]|uniref:DNA ligase n=1 Tax=Pseudoalteromonas sp. SMS1 TaxID=2908894 RepID=UPI001F1A782D|nr:DNA ligase [Pseudoalteromonas sp. SMS1]MCF2857871.1 DNA ligase [Pseudoalteromonas sp. SMS1]
MKLHIIWLIAFLFTVVTSPLSAKQVPHIQLAKVYTQQQPVSHYLVSEKYDGVRAIWDGQQLITRGGHLIHAPHWFTAALPNRWLDGELWAGYNNFAFVSSLIRRKVPNHENWQQVEYLVFDAPDTAVPFEVRYQRYKKLISHLPSMHIKAVTQHSFESKSELDSFYQQVLARGGEGVMLHDKYAEHQHGRTAHLLKYKPKFDAEAVVIAHLPGKGKFKGMMGALKVRMASGVMFNLGTGFSDQERHSPPPIGSTVTFQYQGKTKYGKPRFASFLRVREPL